MSAPFVIGLTGSIGMGKSTTAEMFQKAGIPVWSADDTVHRLYAAEGAGSEAITSLYPDAVGPEGVDRSKLSALIAGDPEVLKTIERVIHPLVAADRARFLADARSDIVVLDIPLLFETGANETMDAVVVVSTSADTQRSRVLARPGMTPEKFELILSKQVPDAQKREKADFIIDSATLETARQQVHDVIEQIRSKKFDA